jgi:hypothetical protein
MKNIVVVNTFRRPFHTRLCLEAICRADRWANKWVDRVLVSKPSNWHEHPRVQEEVQGVIERNPDVRIEVVEPDCPSSPHDISKWLLDLAFAHGAEIAVYVEDDAVLALDAFLMCEFTKRTDVLRNKLLGCCLYHETIPEQYTREGRPEGPDRMLLHLGNGLNTCGGTAFLREPYLEFLSPDWNCKKVEPRGFDYSAHYLMYRHGLYMLWPDLSRSHNIGFELGSISQPDWAKYFGRSIWAGIEESVVSSAQFRLYDFVPSLVKEAWMEAEMEAEMEAIG